MRAARRWTSFSLVLLGVGFSLATACKKPSADPAPGKPPHSGETETPRVPPHTAPPLPAHGWSAEKEALHAVNRLAYGPRPGDIEAVKKAGVSAWMQSQLAPDSLSDEPVLKRLRAMPSLAMSSQELLAAYPRKAGAAAASASADPGEKPHRKGKEAPPAPSGAMPIEGGPREVSHEQVAQKILRAATSERQLQERLVDFWYNHFNVYAGKGLDQWLVTGYERDAIRPFVFGKFRQLLGATAHHPAMLFYLDNWLSKKGAINENYGRELLELHTLGVDGGYTQGDVTEAARVLTGFGIASPYRTATFEFFPKQHDPGPETVLGKRFEGAGVDMGEQLLDLLAAHPSTAKFLCTRLAEAFVSDTPPPALIDRLVKVYQQTSGDLHAVYSALFYSPEFWADASYRAKTKMPFELVISAVRAVGAEVDDTQQLANRLNGMGQPLYQCAPPTGYKARADAWIGTGALIARINFGIALAGGRVKGVSFDREKLVAGAPPEDEGALADQLASVVLHEPLTAATRKVIVSEVATNAKHVAYQEPPPSALPQTLGLLLGSPEFQKR